MNTMTRGLSLGVALVIASISTAQASAPDSHSRKYFDESGAFVGQQYLLCSNQSGHGGNIHTAYFIDEAVPCPGSNADVDVIVPGTIIDQYILPASLTLSAACAEAFCQGSRAQEVIRIEHWPWTFGWQ
jgi:hypothetical protein